MSLSAFRKEALQALARGGGDVGVDIEVLGSRTHLVEYGEPDADRTVVLVHGFRGDHHGLGPVVAQLVKDKLASEDDQKRAEADIQKVTDKHIAEIDQLVAAIDSGKHVVLTGPPGTGMTSPSCRRSSR